MKTKLVLFIILLVVLLSCSKKEIIPELKSLDVPKELIGTWQWVFDYGGLSPTYYTPQSVGMSVKIQFDANHSYKYYENDDLRSQAKFIIEKKHSVSCPDSALIISHIPSSAKRIKYNDMDSLILVDERNQGHRYEHHYSRIK